VLPYSPAAALAVLSIGLRVDSVTAVLLLSVLLFFHHFVFVAYIISVTYSWGEDGLSV
jgi:hypothetical protein